MPHSVAVEAMPMRKLASIVPSFYEGYTDAIHNAISGEVLSSELGPGESPLVTMYM